MGNRPPQITRRTVAAFLGAIACVIGTPMGMLVAYGDVTSPTGPTSSRTYLLGLLILHLDGLGRILLWLAISYTLAFAWARWGNPTGSRRSWAADAASYLVYGTLIFFGFLLIAIDSADRAIRILAEFLA